MKLSPDMNFADFCEIVTSLARDEGAAFTRPDDDWHPLVYTLNRHAISVYNPEALWARGPEGKDFFAQVVLPAILRADKAQMVALRSSAWEVRLPAESIQEARAKAALVAMTGGVSAQQERYEVLLVDAATLTEKRSYRALINRPHGLPPTLDDWQSEGPEISEGRFGDLVQKTLRRIWA